MSEYTEYEITEAMIALGGGFVSNLGRLFRMADQQNQARLRAAFPEYWAEYRKLAALRRTNLAQQKPS